MVYSGQQSFHEIKELLKFSYSVKPKWYEVGELLYTVSVSSIDMCLLPLKCNNFNLYNDTLRVAVFLTLSLVQFVYGG